MKTLLVVFITCLTTTFLFGQSQKYYWVENTRHYINIDSSQYLVEVNALDTKKANLLTNDVDVMSYRIKNELTYQYVIKADARKNFSKRNSLSSKQQIMSPAIHEKGSKSTAFITDEITVKFPTDPDLKTLSAKYGIEVIKKTSYGAYLFKVANRDITLETANRIKENENVIWSNPNFVHIIHLNQVNDPQYANQYYLNNTGQNGGTANIDINAPEAWAVTLGCNTVRVAVIDDGVENHEDFNGRVLPGFTAGFNNTGGAPLNHSSKGHGVSCAGIIAASHNTLGIRGIAPNALIVPVNIFPNAPNINNPGGAATNEEIGAAINWAWRPDGGNADILSNSWGGGVPNADILNEIYNARYYGRGGLGTIVICSAGNSSGGVEFPANINGVITVGAINKNGNIWGYSCTGTEMDLVAPSGNVNLAGDVVTTDRMGTNGFNTAANGNYFNNFGGTSAACPQVSGVAALMLSINPALTEIALRQLLQYTATDMGTTGFDNTYGFGRLNAQAAVEAARIYITGPSLVCSGGSSFTLNNIPIGGQGTWTASPSNLFSTSSGSFTSLTGGFSFSLVPANANVNGSAVITVTTTNSCGGTMQVSKVISVGRPFIGVTYNSGYPASFVPYPNNDGLPITENLICNLAQTNVNITVTGASNGSWQKVTSNPSNVSWSSSGNNLQFYLYSAGQTVRFRHTASNSCGSTANDFYFRSQICGGGGGCDQYTVSPNPARSTIVIAIPNIPPPCNSASSLSTMNGGLQDVEVKAENEMTIESVSLVDFNGQEKFSQHFSDKTKKVDVDVSKLKKGIYILKIQNGKYSELQRIIVE